MVPLLVTVILALVPIGCDFTSTPDAVPQPAAHHHKPNIEPNIELTLQTVTVVAGDDLAWLQSLGGDGPQFVSSYLPTATEPTFKDYDAAFRAWQQDQSPIYGDQQVIQIIGGYLGTNVSQISTWNG